MNTLLALLFLLPFSGAASADVIDLGEFAAGWKAFAPAEGGNPLSYPCPITQCPAIDDSAPIFEAANPDWNTVGYDDSAWSDYNGNWFPSNGTITPFYLRKEFTIGTPNSGSFSIIVDDDYQVWANGVMVLNDNSYGCCTLGTVDLLPHLSAGTNVIAIKAENAPGGGFFINFSGSVNAEAVPEPMSLALLGLGILGLGMSRRR